MRYKFDTAIHQEGSRVYAPIPFNVWEEAGLKGNIPCSVTIEDHCFECKLLPKGGGTYWIPINKKIATVLSKKEELEVLLEPIKSLSRINHDSPYSKEHPVRKIDGIHEIPIQPGFCGHCCVAMLANITLEEVRTLMGKGHSSWSKILETLDYYGITYAEKAVYTKGKHCKLPECCIVNNDKAFLLWYKGRFYGADEVDESKTISYVEIKLS